MKKIFNYLIVFLIFIGIELVDVNAKSFDCDCSSALYQDYGDFSFDFRYHVDERNLSESPKFWVYVNGLTLINNEIDPLKWGGSDLYFNFKLQNYNRVYGKDNKYTVYDEYTTKGTCPSYVILVRDGYYYKDLNGLFIDRKESDLIDQSMYYHVYAADDDSLQQIHNKLQDEYEVVEDPLFGDKTYFQPEIWRGKCRMVNVKEDVVSNSNEPSNEPTDPNSNIPTVNSNKTLDDDNTIYFCGSKYADDAVMRNIPADVPRIIRFIYIFLQVLVPIGIVVVSSIDLFKAISAQKEDDIKKGQQTLIKRIIAAVIIFFVFAIVKLVLSVISDNSDSIIDCISCFLENSDEYCIKHVQ